MGGPDQKIYQTFRTFREFGRPDLEAKGAEQRDQKVTQQSALFISRLTPDRDSTTTRPSIVADESQDLSVFRTCLGVHQLARVENRFGSQRQTEARQLLR